MNILLVDDEKILHETIGDYLRQCGHVVENSTDGAMALQSIKANDHDLALVDFKVPSVNGLSLLERAREIRPEMAVVLITAHGTIDTAIQALRLGAIDFLTKPIKLLELDAVLEKSARIQKLRKEQHQLRDTITNIQITDEHHTRHGNLVGTSPSHQSVRRQVQQAVESAYDTILLTGETGTGKEAVAREIHFLSRSTKSSFVAVNCLQMTDSLFGSEFFAHAKESFTGARSDNPDHFELANGGTMFFDKIGDLSSAAQAELLRVLETRTIRRIRSTNEISFNATVIAATNVPLQNAVDAGNFRSDLFRRLSIFPITLDPLRNRREDIMPLAEHFLSLYAKPRGLHFEGFSPDAKSFMLAYDYPGNARELSDMVLRAAILASNGLIQARHLHPSC